MEPLVAAMVGAGRGAVHAKAVAPAVLTAVVVRSLKVSQGG